MLIEGALVEHWLDRLPGSLICQMWQSIQKAFTFSTSQLVIGNLSKLLPRVFKETKEPQINISFDQLFSCSNISLPFLVKFISHSENPRKMKSKLLNFIDTMGSEIFSLCQNGFDFFSFSKLLLFVFSDENLVDLKSSDTSYNCFTISCCDFKTIELSQTLSLENLQNIPRADFNWLEVDPSGNTCSDSQCPNCRQWLRVLYFKVPHGQQLIELLNFYFDSGDDENGNNAFLQLCFLLHISSAGSLSKIGLLEYCQRLLKEYSTHENCLRNLHLLVGKIVDIENNEEKRCLLESIWNKKFVETQCQKTIDNIEQLISLKDTSSSRSSSSQSADFTAMQMDIDESSVDWADCTSTATQQLEHKKVQQKSLVKRRGNAVSRENAIKQVENLDQIQFLENLQLFIALLNVCDFSEKLMAELLTKLEIICTHKFRRLFFTSIAFICHRLNLVTDDLFGQLSQLLLRALSLFFRDQHLLTFHVDLCHFLFRKSHHKLSTVGTDYICRFITPLINLYRQDSLTNISKITLFHFLCSLAQHCQPDSIAVQGDDEDSAFGLRDILLLFITDSSLSTRCESIRNINNVFQASIDQSDLFEAFQAALMKSMQLSSIFSCNI